MNKNNIIELVLREIKELEILVNGLAGLEQIPDVMFQLSDAKVDNIKNVIRLLSEENDAQANVEQTIQEVAVFQASEEVSIESALLEEAIDEENREIDVEEDAEWPVFNEPEAVIEQEATEEEEVESQPGQAVVVEEAVKAVAMEEISAVEPVAEKKTEKAEKRTLGTVIEKKSSVNEKLSEKAGNSLDKALINRKIIDLKKSINLNDRFRFQKELFKGNASLLGQTLDVLNETEDKKEAIEFLSSFEWNSEDPAVIDFMELINRKFM